MSSDLIDWGTGEAPKPPRSFPANPRPKWHIEPCTFDDLLQRAGPYADATKAFVEWGAVTRWDMSGRADETLASAGIPGDAASLSVLLTRQAVEHETGWPSLPSGRASPQLYDLPEDAQAVARRIADEVQALWETAGRPHFDTRCFKDAYRWLVACVRSGSIPPILSIGHVPPFIC